MQHSLWNLYASIKNGLYARKKSIIHPKNLLCLQLLKVLYKEGYINGFRISSKNPQIVEVFLKYNQGKPVISKFSSLSKPGRRFYASVKTLWKLPTSLSTVLVSTSRGVLSDKECKKLRLGGELLCLIS